MKNTQTTTQQKQATEKDLTAMAHAMAHCGGYIPAKLFKELTSK